MKYIIFKLILSLCVLSLVTEIGFCAKTNHSKNDKTPGQKILKIAGALLSKALYTSKHGETKKERSKRLNTAAQTRLRHKFTLYLAQLISSEKKLKTEIEKLIIENNSLKEETEAINQKFENLKSYCLMSGISLNTANNRT